MTSFVTAWWRRRPALRRRGGDGLPWLPLSAADWLRDGDQAPGLSRWDQYTLARDRERGYFIDRRVRW